MTLKCKIFFYVEGGAGGGVRKKNELSFIIFKPAFRDS